LDAETGRPVPNATVTVVHNFDWMDDWVTDGTTDAAGETTIKLAREYLHLVRARVAAPGYLGRDDVYFGNAKRPGHSPLDADPVDLLVYSLGPPSMGLRVPPGFSGSFVYVLGAHKYTVASPPDFPAGQRVWWTTVTPETETVVEQPPRLGGSGWNGNPVTTVARGTEMLPVPEPGSEVSGIAAWHIGVRQPNGAWGGNRYVLVIGTRDAALSAVRDEWKHHGNGEAGFIYNGWLRLIAPDIVRTGGGAAYSVTRFLPARDRTGRPMPER
jgi:hypothetical protein